MVNWQSPQTLVSETRYYLNLTHVVDGIYIWEWITNLAFDYQLAVHCSKSFKWPIAVYLICRLSGAVVALLNLMVYDLTHRFNCEALYTCLYIATYISVFTASTLVALRTMAIWNQHRYITWFLTLALAGYGGSLLYVAIVGNRASWNEAKNACEITHAGVSKMIFTYAMVFDCGSLVLALVGVQRLWNRAHGGMYLILYQQGVVWIIIIAFAYMVPLVFLYLDLNEIMDTIFQLPAVPAILIAATRMYRGLHEISRSGAVHFIDPTTSGRLRIEPYVMSVDRSAVGHRTDNDTIEMNVMKISDGSACFPGVTRKHSCPEAFLD